MSFFLQKKRQTQCWTFLHAPTEFSHEIFFKPQVHIENCRFRVFLMILGSVIQYWHTVQVGDLFPNRGILGDRRNFWVFDYLQRYIWPLKSHRVPRPSPKMDVSGWVDVINVRTHCLTPTELRERARQRSSRSTLQSSREGNEFAL